MSEDKLSAEERVAWELFRREAAAQAAKSDAQCARCGGQLTREFCLSCAGKGCDECDGGYVFECNGTHQRKPDNVPQWTSTPPSEPGWYWIRYRPHGAPVPLEVRRLYADDPASASAWISGMHVWLRPSMTDYLWWPVPLTPPETRKHDNSAPECAQEG